MRGPEMPIGVLLHGEVCFGPEEIENLTAAFELALSKLDVSDRHDPLAVVLAKRIIELAKKGERDPNRLCLDALRLVSLA